MNEKLKAWEGRLSTKSVGRGYHRRVESLVVLQTGIESAANKKGGRDILRVSLHERVLGLTGWVHGDTLEMEISGESATIYRSPEGRCLSKSCKNEGSRSSIRYSFNRGDLVGFPCGKCREVEAKPGQIAFLLPESIGSSQTSGQFTE
jgi:hypothetical protein